jgi:hypothetical protein
MTEYHYDKHTRAEMAKAFKLAQRYLSRGDYDNKTRYICFSFEPLVRDSRINPRIFTNCVNEITRRLHPHASVVQWLQHRGYLPMQRHAYAYDRDVQEYRHRWLKALIKEFQS